MNDDQRNAPATGERAGVMSQLRRLATWKKVMLAGSLVLMVLGLALQGVALAASPAEPVATTGTGVDPLVAHGFAPNGGGDATTSTTTTDPDAMGTWSPVVFRFGFSFFVGFCIAFAARTFLRIAVLVTGMILLALFGLQYAGVIDVNWDAMAPHFDRLTHWLASQTSSFGDFIRGYLPSAAMGGFGMVVGFRRG